MGLRLRLEVRLRSGVVVVAAAPEYSLAKRTATTAGGWTNNILFLDHATDSQR